MGGQRAADTAGAPGATRAKAEAPGSAARQRDAARPAAANALWLRLAMRQPGATTGAARTLAASSDAGNPLPDGVRARAEARTAVNLSAVRVHHDVAARGVAVSLGATAATAGTDIFVARPPSDGVLLHEAVHAAQSIAGGSDLGARAVESEARSIAEGRPARPRAAPAAGSFSRYEGPEHQDIGMAGWRDRIALPNYPRGLTYGEIVSLAGDIYGSFEQLTRAPAAEIDRVLIIMEQQRQKYGAAHDKAIASGKDEQSAVTAGGEAGYDGLEWGIALNRATGGRYLELAAGSENLSHFSDQNKNLDRYRREHEAAIAAARSGKAEEARARDGFAAHYLSDRFSAGHMRASVSAAALERKRQHDHDNVHGLNVINEHGDAWKMYGDGRLHDPRNAMNLHLASEAVRASQRDIERASRGEPIPTFASTRSGRAEYLALQLVPWMGRDNDPIPTRTAGELAGQLGKGFLKDIILPTPILGGAMRAFADLSDWLQEDDRAREQVAAGKTARLPVQQRVILIRQMLSGSCGDDDERAIIRLFAEATADEQVQMADDVDLEHLYDKIDGEELDLFILTVKPMFRRWAQARKIDHITRRFKGWTKGWEENVCLTILEVCDTAELQRIIDHFGVRQVRSELDGHMGRLGPLLSRAGR